MRYLRKTKDTYIEFISFFKDKCYLLTPICIDFGQVVIKSINEIFVEGKICI